MQTFIDLEGASGAIYRFRRIDDLSALPAIAGNFVYVQGDSPKPVVVCAGVDETLLNAAAGWADAQKFHGACTIYVRKNVSWRVRAAEHEDIVKRHQPALVLAEEFDRKIGLSTGDSDVECRA